MTVPKKKLIIYHLVEKMKIILAYTAENRKSGIIIRLSVTCCLYISD